VEKTIASEILDTLHESSFLVDQVLGRLKGTCSTERFRPCATLLGSAMSDMFDGVMAPVYGWYPELAPDWYREGPPRGTPEIPQLQLSRAARGELLAAFDAAYEKVQATYNGLSRIQDPLQRAVICQGLHQVSLTLCRAKVALLSAELDPDELDG